MANKRMLVTYATVHGSTAFVAGRIAETFKGFGAYVDVLHIGDATNPALYDAVVIGSPIRYDSWLPDAKAYVAAHEAMLAARPVAYFFTCMALSVPGGDAQGQRYAEQIAAQNIAVTPVGVGRFAGALDLKKIPIFLRLPARILLRTRGAKNGDFRDPDVIRSWSQHCLASFQLKKTMETKL